MREQPTSYPTQAYTDHLTDGSFCWVAEHPDLPGCVSYADDLTEALAGLDESREAYLRSLRERGLPIPEPSQNPDLATWESQDTSEEEDEDWGQYELSRTVA